MLDHIQEVAEETGVEFPEATSSESIVKYKGHSIEVWYNEDSASAYAWCAFVKGFGTTNAENRNQAVSQAKDKIEKRSS